MKHIDILRELIADNYMETIQQDLNNGDKSLLYALLKGDGLKPVSDLTDEEVLREAEELGIEVEEKTVPITYGLIKATIGWSRFCDVTGHNHYAINEWGDYPDREVFRVKENHAKKLGFLK